MRRLVYCCLLSCLIVHSAGLGAEEPIRRPGSFEKYKPVYEKNIFSRMRYTPSAQDGAGQTRMEKVVLSLYVLRGVAVETKNRLAFVEDEISGQSKRLAVGAQLLDGTIDQIEIDRVLFKHNDKLREVRIGQEFDRVESEVARPAASAGSSADPNSAPAAPQSRKMESAPSSGRDEDAILKKLMERRKQELGN
ncbi:MAG: hypothetical protein LLF76_01035 [Planctomycetaceae bacterium]|nr:hypothetical protein [Planctomycetaceae bacterium]